MTIYTITEHRDDKTGEYFYYFRINSSEATKPAKGYVELGKPHLYDGKAFVVMHDARDAITFCNHLNKFPNDSLET